MRGCETAPHAAQQRTLLVGPGSRQHIDPVVALDFLGFGLPAPTPSWGELIQQGTENLNKWWLTVFPLSAVFLTLLLIVFIGEAVRDAFDPNAGPGSRS